MIDRDRRKVLAILAGVAIALGAVGSTIAVQPTATNDVMTGHTEWMEASTNYDGCLAGIAGLILQQVTWFNGKTLFETSSGTSENTWVYFTDGGLETKVDPTDEDLFRSNETYEFEDPNRDHTWTVKEYYIQDAGLDGVGSISGADPGVSTDRVYIWAVNASAETFHDPTIEQDYNFVGILNTCKFNTGADGDVDPDHNDQYDQDKREAEGEEDTEDPRWQHDSENTEGTHDHDVYVVDIWIGGEPSLVPGTETLADLQNGDASGGDAE